MKDVGILKKIYGYFTNKEDEITSQGSRLKLKGRIEVFVKKSGKIIDHFSQDNLVLYNGEQRAIEALALGASNHRIFRMAIGSEGAMSSDLFQPKIPTKDMTALYHEVYRKDVNPPSIGTRSATFVADFNSTEIDDSAFNNASLRYINEAALVCGDGLFGGGDITPPATPDSDESLFSIRTFKSIPFDAGDDVTITVRWTVFTE